MLALINPFTLGTVRKFRRNILLHVSLVFLLTYDNFAKKKMKTRLLTTRVKPGTRCTTDISKHRLPHFPFHFKQQQTRYWILNCRVFNTKRIQFFCFWTLFVLWTHGSSSMEKIRKKRAKNRQKISKNKTETKTKAEKIVIRLWFDFFFEHYKFWFAF